MVALRRHVRKSRHSDISLLERRDMQELPAVALVTAPKIIHMQGRTLEVVSQSLITSYHFKTGKPFPFTVCSVRDVTA